MRRLALYSLSILAMVFVGLGLTDLDYHLGKSKYGSSSITEDERFHGDNSAMLSVKKAGTYIRASIYFDEPLPIEDLEYLSMWMYPQSGDGNVRIELLLDGDGDEKYKSGNAADARLRSVKQSWSDMGMSSEHWNELDGFDLSYERYGEDGFSNMDNFKRDLKGMRVLRLYITIYKDPSFEKTSALLDYIKIADQIISFEPLEQEVVKSGPKTVSPGSQITFTLTYGNNLMEPIDLAVVENYDPRTAFVSATPEPDPGTNNIWTFRNLSPGQHGQIVVKVRTSKFLCEADIKGKASGVGYVSASNLLSNDFESYVVTNRVLLSSAHFNSSATVSTSVRPVEGSALSFEHHGCGSYQSQEHLSYSSSSLFAHHNLTASRSLTSVSLLSFPITFGGSWYAGSIAQSWVRDISWQERYYYAHNLSLDCQARLSKYNTDLQSTASFSGFADIAEKWKDTTYNQQFSGSFSIESEAHSKQSKKTKTATEDGLNCCFGALNDSIL